MNRLLSAGLATIVVFTMAGCQAPATPDPAPYDGKDLSTPSARSAQERGSPSAADPTRKAGFDSCSLIEASEWRAASGYDVRIASRRISSPAHPGRWKVTCGYVADSSAEATVRYDVTVVTDATPETFGDANENTGLEFEPVEDLGDRAVLATTEGKRSAAGHVRVLTDQHSISLSFRENDHGEKSGVAGMTSSKLIDLARTATRRIPSPLEIVPDQARGRCARFDRATAISTLGLRLPAARSVIDGERISCSYSAHGTGTLTVNSFTLEAEAQRTSMGLTRHIDGLGDAAAVSRMAYSGSIRTSVTMAVDDRIIIATVLYPVATEDATRRPIDPMTLTRPEKQLMRSILHTFA